MNCDLGPYIATFLSVTPAHLRRPWNHIRQLILKFCCSSPWGEVSYLYMNFYQREIIRGSSWSQSSFKPSFRHDGVRRESAVQLDGACCRHRVTATANTLTTQYMVRFSHLTVQLPERDKQAGEITHSTSSL